MNKKLIIFGVAILLICVRLSGCNETSNNTVETSGETDKVELVEYDVKTEWSIRVGDSYEYQTTNGINQNQPQNSEANSINILGKVKNIAGVKLDRIMIKAKFFDSNNNYLDEYSSYCWNIANSYTDVFEIRYWGEYVEDVDSFKFEFSTSD